ncbi:MAG TPA: tRNA 2-thiouridine(34) synthase MnmA [Mariprofundaceae bacterium]|nr:tRNA 2-thiouridine(34) synthase MnmA [Mariprofundaceae bacterium]
MMSAPDLTVFRGKRVIAAMSGGVDSSVMAALLKEAGIDVVGVFLHVWDYSRDEVTRHGSCCATEDAYDARRVADHLGIPFYSMDMRETFRRDVIDPFVADYESGRTPNPCERCNRFVKFGSLLEAADRLEAEYVATGHYVQRRDDEHGVHIFRGSDPAKDQSYFLATTDRAQMARLLFPVGHLQKEQTRRLAARFDLPTAAKQESQDICFIPAGDRIAFLKREGAEAGFLEGEIVDRTGRVLGHHLGIAHYTIGQRRGLGLSGGPWHVVALDGSAARVVVAPVEETLIRRVSVEDVRWIRRPARGEPVEARLRYRSRSAPCAMTVDGGAVSLRFDAPQSATAPGQVAALYAGDELLGGGVVQRVSM